MRPKPMKPSPTRSLAPMTRPYDRADSAAAAPPPSSERRLSPWPPDAFTIMGILWERLAAAPARDDRDRDRTAIAGGSQDLARPSTYGRGHGNATAPHAKRDPRLPSGGG